MSSPKVSILIPTFNGEGDLERLLPALEGQRYGGELEFIAIDSSSDDRSAEMLRGAGFEVTVIDRADFGHGRTRNALARRAGGELLVFLSQDALPIGDDFVARMVEPFDDADVAGVTARVLPNVGDDALTARTVEDSPEASPLAETRRWSSTANYESMTGPERVALLRFNNVASCVRASVLGEQPFPEVPFGEDFAWAARAMAQGHAIHHAGGACVRHAHRYGPRAAYERYRIDAIFHREFHDFAVRPGLVSAIRGVAFELSRDLAYMTRHGAGFADVVRAPFLRSAQVLGQYVGSRGGGDEWSAARRRGALNLSGALPASPS
ncbi:MAG: glycosyltransferase [Planctomycetota bacterium]|nr:glycosyltransferase [Planctomycetota bacterium]